MIYGQQTVGPSCEFFLLMSVLRMFSVFVLTRSSVQFTQFVLLSIHLFGGLLFLAFHCAISNSPDESIVRCEVIGPNICNLLLLIMSVTDFFYILSVAC